MRLAGDGIGTPRPVGGGALKQWEVELLRPSTVVALERSGELSHILVPLRKEPHIRVWDLPVCAETRQRSREERAKRQALLRRCLSGGKPFEIPGHLPIYGDGPAGTICALQDEDGIVLSLGVLLSRGRALRVQTRLGLGSASSLRSVRLGSVCVDPATGEEYPMAAGRRTLEAG